MNGDDGKVEAARTERRAVRHAVDLKALVLDGADGEADLGHETGGFHRPLIVDEGEALRIAGHI